MAKRMSAEELIAEYEWLVSNVVHPLLAAQELKRKPATLAKMLSRYHLQDLANGLYRSTRA